jgi:drug/metabolite transporter (DMT)-like permease
MTTRTATAIGFTAVLLWSLLALLTAATGTIPPFQLSAMTFLIGGLVGTASWIARPQGIRALRQKPVVWALGLGGLFGYHALYFAALRLAPPADHPIIVTRPIQNPEVSRTIGVVRRRGGRLAPAAERFLELLLGTWRNAS